MDGAARSSTAVAAIGLYTCSTKRQRRGERKGTQWHATVTACAQRPMPDATEPIHQLNGVEPSPCIAQWRSCSTYAQRGYVCRFISPPAVTINRHGCMHCVYVRTSCARDEPRSAATRSRVLVVSMHRCMYKQQASIDTCKIENNDDCCAYT
jgi:hypothetical protein